MLWFVRTYILIFGFGLYMKNLNSQITTYNLESARDIEYIIVCHVLSIFESNLTVSEIAEVNTISGVLDNTCIYSNARCVNNGSVLNNGSSCYWITQIMTTWRNSSAECRKQGGSLATIPNINVNQQLINSGIISSNISFIWIGLTDIEVERRYVDENGKVAEWSNWARFEPSDLGFSAPQDCVAVRVSEELKWDDRSCASLYEALCFVHLGSNVTISTKTNYVTSTENSYATLTETNYVTSTETSNVTTIETTKLDTTETALVVTTIDSSRLIPVYTYCPHGIFVYTRSTAGTNVEWQEVTATVTSGNVTVVIQSKAVNNGNVFNIGTTTVRYIANNTRSLLSQICEFNITVQKIEMPCSDFPVIQNGNVICGSRGGRASCFIQNCDAGYLLYPGINRNYTCNGFMGWIPPIPPLLSISACFRPVPLVAYLNFNIIFRCTANSQITAYDVIDCLNNFNLCPSKSSGITLCSPEQINATTYGNIIRVNASTLTNLGPGADRANLTRQLLEVNRNIINFFNTSTVMCNPLSGCVVDNATTSATTIFGCPVGSQQINYRGNITCALCSVGRFYSISTGICFKCGNGTYQDKPRLTFCLSCPRLRPLSNEASFRKQHCYAGAKTNDKPDIYLFIYLPLLIVIVIIVIAISVFVFIQNVKRKRSKKQVEEELSVYEHYVTVR